jgi:hypothetical protein
LGIEFCSLDVHGELIPRNVPAGLMGIGYPWAHLLEKCRVL